MKLVFNFFANIMNLGDMVGFMVAKGINKFLYGLVFSSFDESREKLQIEKVKIDSERREIEIAKKEIEIEARKYKERQKDLERLASIKGIDKEEFEATVKEQETLKTRLEEKNTYIKALEDRVNAAETKAKLVEKFRVKTTAVGEKGGVKEKIRGLLEEIDLLNSEIDVLKKQKGFTGEKVKTKIKEVKPPVLKKSRNPFELVVNILKYRKERKGFEVLVRKYLELDKATQNNRAKKCKPDSIKEFDRYLQVGDRYVRIYYLADLPNTVAAPVLFKLINIPIPLTLSYIIKGTDKGAMIKAARQRTSVLESLQNDNIKKKNARDPKIQREVEEVDEFINNLVHDLEKVFLVSAYAVISAESKKELLQYDEKFQDETGDIEFTFNTYSFGQQRAFDSTLPLGENTVKQEHLLQTTAVCNLLPFLSRNLNDPAGIFIGTNHYNNSLILVDLFKARNANINILGTSGSGKSVTSKIMMTRLAIRGVQNIILDPEGEYIDLTNALEGQVVRFNREKGINPFFIGSPTDNAKRDHVSVLKHFFKFFIQESRYDSAKLDKLLVNVYEKDCPTFGEFLKLCKKEKAPFSEDLEQLQTGSLAGIFNSDRSINLNANVICFDLSELRTDEKKIPAMYLLGTIINRLIDDSARRRMIFIDEAHKLLVNQQTTNFYVDLVKTARKRNAGVVSITQNPEDFKQENNSMTILTQSETSILLKQAYASVKHIETNNLFRLTESEKAELPTLSVGESLFIRENEHIYIDIMPFQSEQPLVFTS